MDLFQEVTLLVPGTGEEKYAPTTFKRSATTSVSVKDGQTMVIGGLIGDNLTIGNSKVPLFGDIPFLGYLFKTLSRNREKTNLYIFITPHIIDTVEKASDLYNKKYGEVSKVESSLRREAPETSKGEVKPPAPAYKEPEQNLKQSETKPESLKVTPDEKPAITNEAPPQNQTPASAPAEVKQDSELKNEQPK